jgi:pimeloyl-ACP methyl ester carboxylesterase
MHKSILNIDGRSLEIYTQGTPSNSALILHHGGLASTLNMAPIFRAAKKEDVFVIGITRPGYAESTSDPGRRADDYLEYTSYVLDNFDITSFVSLGWSSGAPAALSDARDIRCKGAISISGDAPKGNIDWSEYEEKYPAENLTSKYGYTLELSDALNALRNVVGADLSRVFGDALSKADVEICDGPYGEELASAIGDGMAPGDDGLIQDVESDHSDWGFDLREITNPVAIFQGDEDRMDTPANGHFLKEHIPNSELILLKGEGHISVIYKYSHDIVVKALEFLYK